MNKKEVKTALVGVAIGVLSGYIVLLLPLPNKPLKTAPQLYPRLIYVQHQESAHSGNLTWVTKR